MSSNWLTNVSLFALILMSRQPAIPIVFNRSLVPSASRENNVIQNWKRRLFWRKVCVSHRKNFPTSYVSGTWATYFSLHKPQFYENIKFHSDILCDDMLHEIRNSFEIRNHATYSRVVVMSLVSNLTFRCYRWRFVLLVYARTSHWPNIIAPKSRCVIQGTKGTWANGTHVKGYFKWEPLSSDRLGCWPPRLWLAGLWVQTTT